jgi:tetratricopeptide (TPR) repeat protein
MRITPFRCAIALTLFVAMTAPAMAQNLVRGTVRDSKNAPVEGALVHFEAIDFVAKRDTKTDKKGEYLFQGLGSGDYNVTASKEGVGTQTRKWTIGAATSKEKLDFILAPTKAMIEAHAEEKKAAATAPPAGLESLAVDAAAVAKGKEFAAIQAIAGAAVEAQKAGQHEEAVTKFSELVAKVPDCSDCYVRLGASYNELKKYDEAVAAFKKSIQVRPSVEAYTSLARIYNSQKKFDLASDATQEAADLAAKLSGPPPGSAPVPGAATGVSEAVATSANSDTLYNRGVVLWNQSKFAEAKVQFEAAVKANPKNADAQYQLGMANLNLGQMAAARAAFEAYLVAAPSGPKATEVKGFLTQLPK